MPDSRRCGPRPSPTAPSPGARPLIDEPLWVLPSVVILESIPSEKSGVLVTADIETGEQGKMLIATSEGVGGAVDGTPAETLLWSPDGRRAGNACSSPPTAGCSRPTAAARSCPSPAASTCSPRGADGLVTAAARRSRETLEPAFGSAGGRARLGRGVRLRGRQALAVPDATLHRQRVSRQRAGRRPPYEAPSPAAPSGSRWTSGPVRTGSLRMVGVAQDRALLGAAGPRGDRPAARAKPKRRLGQLAEPPSTASTTTGASPPSTRASRPAAEDRDRVHSGARPWQPAADHRGGADGAWRLPGRPAG